jgi:hypothetical protein
MRTVSPSDLGRFSDSKTAAFSSVVVSREAEDGLSAADITIRAVTNEKGGFHSRLPGNRNRPYIC